MIGIRIQALLESAKKDVADLARYLDVTPQAVYPWLKGEREPKPGRKQAIADFFNISQQELEYTPLLSLAPLVRIKSGVTTQLDIAMSAHAADMMIEAELRGSQKSSEFRQGMRDRLTLALSDITSGTSYATGTCQADAYDAGIARAETVIEKLKL